MYARHASIATLAMGLLLAGTPAFAQQSGKRAATPAAKTAPAAAGTTTAVVAHKKTVPDKPIALTAAPDAQRLAAQADLVWLGNFDELSAEEIDKNTLEGIKAFQRRNGDKDTGVLTEQERALLAQAARAPQTAAGWRLIDDTATGARLGVPERLVPRTSAGNLGTRWSSAGGQIQIETFRLHEASLPALFDQEKKTAQRYVGSGALSLDSFVITGEQKLKKFVERAQASGNEVRGVTILYDQATEGTMASVALAVADTFEGFPDPNAALPAGRKRGVDYGSAIVASSQGDLLSLGELTEDCQSITVPGFGHAERIATDRTDNLALLRIYGARNLVPATLAGDAPAPGASGAVTLYGIPDPLAQPGNGAVTAAAAQLNAQGLDPAPNCGFAGAAAVDAQGRFAGIVAMKAPVVAGVGPTALQATLVSAETVRAFLRAQGITPAATRSAMEQSVVRIICVRK
jgi:hypothetical protein